MEYILAVFRVRTETMLFYDRLKKNGINANIINTPKQASVSCGISVKFPARAFSVAHSIVHNNFKNFVAFYKIYYSNGRMILNPVNF